MPSINPIIFIILFIGIGLISAFFGWKLHRIFVFVVGGIPLAFLGFLFFGILGAIFGFILGGILAQMMEILLVLVLGFFIGYILGYYYLNNTDIGIVLGIIFAIIFPIIYVVLISLITAILGGLFVGIGVILIFPNTQLFMVVTFIVAGSGFLFQIGIAPKLNIDGYFDRIKVKKKVHTYKKDIKTGQTQQKILEKTYYCRACGTINPMNSQFCMNCGKKFTKVKCKHCNYENDEDVLYCGNCGKQIKK